MRNKFAKTSIDRSGIARRAVFTPSIFCVAGFVLAFAACSNSSRPASGISADAPSCADPAPPQAIDASLTDAVPSDFDATANPSPSTTIYFTLMLPQRCPGQTFPLILQSHGYGGSRLTALAPDGGLHASDPMFPSIDELTQALPYHGYAVISFDERGHGESVPANGGGNARMIDPAAETQDARAVLDWAYDHADEYAIETEPDSGIAKDIKVGTLGYSYGGGFQLPLAALDARVDTIVPVGTWHDQYYSTVPGNTVKLSFDGILCLLAASGNVSNTPLMQALCNTVGIRGPDAFDMRSLDNLVSAVSDPGTLPRAVSRDEILSFFTTHGMNYFANQQKAGLPWGYGESQATLRKVPALFLQGNRDVLFNLTEAYWNWRYFREAGGDVRLLSTEGGHMNPIAYQTEGTADCGTAIGVDAILAWFDRYLKGHDSATFDAIPTVCLSVADTVGAPDVPPVAVKLGDFPVGSLSGAGAVPARLDALSVQVPNSAVKPVFVRVITIHGDNRVLAGVPTIGTLTVSALPVGSPGPSTNAFVGVGIRRGGRIILVDDQITGFNLGTHSSNDNVDEDDRILLPAVGERLRDRDQVGLLFYPQHVQFAAIVSGEGLAGFPGLVNEAFGSHIPPITSSLEPLLGLLYVNPYGVEASDIELPIFVPGTYAGSQLLQ